jgi:hypothetical protein
LKGIFELRSPDDLLRKLEADFARVTADPLDSHAAFDFFVTAWHLVEWKHPPPTQATEHSALLARRPILRVCEHIAVGAKHFEPTSKQHKSVVDTAATGAWAKGGWAPGSWTPGAWSGDLVVHLDGQARDQLGPTIAVQELARRVVDVWRSEFSRAPG